MRQFIILIAVAEILCVCVKVKNAVVLLNNRFFCLAGCLCGDNVELLSACGHHTHELYACADGCLSACGSTFEKVRCHIMHAVDEVDIFL